MIVKEERIQIVDHTTYPLLIPKKFFKCRPSVTAIAVYMALNMYDEGAVSGDPSKMAKLVSLSEKAFEEGIAELVEKEVIRPNIKTRKTRGGKPLPPITNYDLLEI